MKPLYILEGREMKYSNRRIPNIKRHTIGIFTTPKKAESWIKTEGKKFYPKHWKQYKKYFWVLCKYTPNETGGIYYKFYDLQ
jgi:coproporphyrinogen III oxidase